MPAVKSLHASKHGRSCYEAHGDVWATRSGHNAVQHVRCDPATERMRRVHGGAKVVGKQTPNLEGGRDDGWRRRAGSGACRHVIMRQDSRLVGRRRRHPLDVEADMPSLRRYHGGDAASAQVWRAPCPHFIGTYAFVCARISRH